MPLNVDVLGTGSLVVNNQEVNVSGMNTSYQKLNKDWSYITVSTTETVIDSILVPARFSCGSLTPYVNFAGNLSAGQDQTLTFRIYLNEKPILDGNETLISRPVDNQFVKGIDVEAPAPIDTSTTFSFGASFLENILLNVSYSYKDQNKTTIDYVESSRMISTYSIGSIETYDCTKQYYAILTATKTGDSIDVASIVVTLDKNGGGAVARPA